MADRLTAYAEWFPDQIAVAEPHGRDPGSRAGYGTISFAELNTESEKIARGLLSLGVQPGERLALLVRPGIDFIALVFGLLKAGVVLLLIDPGMGPRRLLGCLQEVKPDGFVALPWVHTLRKFLYERFPDARFNVTVGSRSRAGAITLRELKRRGETTGDLPHLNAEDSAAIIFTSGSTGPPKGVHFTHGNFNHQTMWIRDFYGIGAGEIDLPGFPLFGLFNCAMGVTTIVPRMNPTRPARVDPAKIVAAANAWQVTQAFASPAMWNRVGEYCERTGAQMSSVRRVLSAGAAVPVHVLRRMKACIHPEGEVHTPYGATESLPVASISATEILQETAKQTARGAGVCVGRKFPGVRWKVIRSTEHPLTTLDQVEELPPGQIGEIIVSGPVVTRSYVTRREFNERSKISEGDAVWHRIGDVGYFDERQRFWYCGRAAHVVTTPRGPLYPEQCEAILNQHAKVSRSALVGVGPAGRQVPVLIVEPRRKSLLVNPQARRRCQREWRELVKGHAATSSIDIFLLRRSFPVDVRHNAKISREELAVWATRRLGVDFRPSSGA